MEDPASDEARWCIELGQRFEAGSNPPIMISVEASVIRLETNRRQVKQPDSIGKPGYAEVAPFSAEPYADYGFEKELN